MLLERATDAVYPTDLGALATTHTTNVEAVMVTLCEFGN